MKRALIILAHQGYQDQEYAGVRNGLEETGFSIVIGSTIAGMCTGRFGGAEQTDVALRDVRVGEYDCVAFIGGPGAALLKEDPEALRIAHETVRAQKPLGAICIAPLILARAKVLEGRRATVWDGGTREQIAELERYGAIFTGESVSVDGRIVTGDGPGAAEEFGKTLGSL
ncbi:DJ-1 family protein [Candidatus Peregrinibacteria bacterium CG10_big_fil_rev_8_21_14_0_10_55_24]|nr:MAG: DJ-1 family protein [Candidatus Peregrinibacteria bacterium CG10_big_fil_rev_8_21_14_0_10_55_24]